MDQQTETIDSLYGCTAPPARQRAAFAEGSVPVAVYGLGKMGLPLAAVFAAVTGNVTGADVDPTVVETIERGESPVDGEPGLDEAVSTSVGSGALSATTDPGSAAADASVHVLIVPTLLDDDREPDLATLRAATEAVGTGLAPGDVVFVESTVPPRTCEDVIDPTLREESGLDGDEFGLAFCPERTSSGRAFKDIRRAYPKIVGGRDAESERVASLVYDQITDNDVIGMGDCTSAECVKVFEGVYRDVNIALANELARFAEELDVDVRSAIDAANTQPFCDIHDPGPGVGGHCIPYYPYFLIKAFDTETPLLEAARRVNREMPAYTVDRLAAELERQGTPIEDATVALLGLAYRPGVDETRASPAYPIAEDLADRGAEVYVTDPVVTDVGEIPATAVTIDLLPAVDPDGVIVVTPQEEFEAIGWSEMDPAVVLDSRDAVTAATVDAPVYTLGRSGLTGPSGEPASGSNRPEEP